jgi:peptidase E
VSWDDRFPEALHLFVVRVARDELAITAYAAKARAFLAEVDLEVAALTTVTQPAAVLQAAVEVA